MKQVVARYAENAPSRISRVDKAVGILRKNKGAALGLLLTLALSCMGCATDGERSQQQVRELLLASAPHSADASLLNDLNGEEVALSSPLIVGGVIVATSYNTDPSSITIKIDSVYYRAHDTKAISVGTTITAAGPFGIELPQNIGVIAGFRRRSGTDSVAPTWITAFAAVGGRHFFASTNANREIAFYPTTKHNLFGCLTLSQRAQCRHERLESFGVVGAARLATYDNIVARDAYAALLWMQIRRRLHDRFPSRLCRGLSDVDNCASSEAFSNKLQLRPYQ